MFSFFSKKPSENEAIAFGNSLANRAILDVVFKEGVPTFVIVVDQRGADIRSNFEHRQAVAEFIAAVEQRIIDEFPSDPSDYLGLPKEILGDRTHEFERARRVVATSESKGLFHWRYDENSEIQISSIA